MQVHSSVETLPSFTRPVLTIGTFDGVHRGHQQILAALKAEAARVSGETVLITFDPHPRKIVQPESSLQLINTLPEKTALLAAQGLDHLVVVPFSPQVAGWEPEAYVRDFLVHHFRPHTLIIGYDHHFGKDRRGNFELLKQLQTQFDYELIEIPKHLLDEVAISSTKIRQALWQSDVATPNRLLGYPFFFEGLVTTGDQIGRTLGYPTANLLYTDTDKIHLGEGVFAGRVQTTNGTFDGMLSIGKRPTLGDTLERVEVNLFDFAGDLYGQNLVVHVEAFIRPQYRFDSLAALTQQLHADKEATLRVLAATP